MGFVAILLAAAAALSLWVWRARNAADIARQAGELVGEARSAARRFGYKRQLNKNPLDTVDDPRLAVAGILVALARLDGDLSREQMQAIARQCAASFEVAPEEADDMAAFGRWLSQQAQPEEAMRRLARGLRSELDAERTASLDRMMQEVARVEGGAVSESQDAAIAMIHRTLR